MKGLVSGVKIPGVGLISGTIAGIQPMKGPTGIVFYLKTRDRHLYPPDDIFYGESIRAYSFPTDIERPKYVSMVPQGIKIYIGKLFGDMV